MLFSEYFNQYIENLNYILNEIDIMSVHDLINEMVESTRAGKRIFLIGNGGSAATCNHMVTDFGVGCMKAPNCNLAFNMISLCNNNSVITAISNDDYYQNVYSHQLKLYCNQGDLLIIISASGNSINLINAAQYANEHNINTYGILGFDGGRLKYMCKKSIHIKSEINQYGLVEDVALILNHIMSNWVKISC